MKVNIDEAVQAYINLREERAKLLREYEDQDSVLKNAMSEIDQVLLGVCNEINADSFKTAHGTVMRQIKERYVCNDWDGFRQFEHEHPDYDFREKRVHQGVMRLYREEHPDDGLPPGLNSMREFQIVVRKSTQ